MPHLTALPGKTPSIDYSLLISRLEGEIIRGGDTERCIRILGQQRIWINLSPNLLLKWATLAQMVGAVEITLTVYAHIHQVQPEMVQAWIEHIELLAMLDKRVEAAQVMAAARPHLNPEQQQACLNLTRSSGHSDKDIGIAALPFETMRTRQQAIEHYMDMFSGREDCFARQWTDRAEQKQGYVPVKRPLEYKDIEDHIMGRLTYGIYLLRSDSTVKTAVMDVDLVQKYRQSKLSSVDAQLVRREQEYLLRRIHELSIQMGMRPVIEFSGGKGFHFWYCFESPVSAGFARQLLEMSPHLTWKCFPNRIICREKVMAILSNCRWESIDRPESIPGLSNAATKRLNLNWHFCPA